MPLTEKEKLELESLEDRNVQFMGSALNPVGTALIGNSRELSRRKERIVELRVKKRMEEEKIDPNEDFSAFYRIRAEEEKLVNEKFDK